MIKEFNITLKTMTSILVEHFIYPNTLTVELLSFPIGCWQRKCRNQKEATIFPNGI